MKNALTGRGGKDTTLSLYQMDLIKQALREKEATNECISKLEDVVARAVDEVLTLS